MQSFDLITVIVGQSSVSQSVSELDRAIQPTTVSQTFDRLTVTDSD